MTRRMHTHGHSDGKRGELEHVQRGEPTEEQTGAPSHEPLALVDYIERTHHVNARAELARLLPLAEKVRRLEGGKRKELFDLGRVLAALAQELDLHMFKEEQVLFPYIRRLVLESVPDAPFADLTFPLFVMHGEHERVGIMLEELSALTQGYQTATDACASFRALYEGLAALQSDLHQHMHLEDEVLFPAAVRLEARLRNPSPVR